jgi:hypothetical protein
VSGQVSTMIFLTNINLKSCTRTEHWNSAKINKNSLFQYWILSFCLVSSFTKYSGNQIEKNEIGGAYSTYGGKERCIQDFGEET